MDSLLSGLLEVLVQAAAETVVGLVTGAVVEQDDRLAPNPSAQPGTLDHELEQLRKLLLEYELKIELRRPARAFLLRGIKKFDGDAHELVKWHIRQPLADLINDSQVKRGDTVVVDCIDGVLRVTGGPG